MSITPWEEPPEYMTTTGWGSCVNAIADECLKNIYVVDGKVDLTPGQLRNLIADVWIRGKED